MTWTIVTPHGIFKSPQPCERLTVPAPGTIGIDRVCFATSIDPQTRHVFCDRVVEVRSPLGYAADAEAAFTALMRLSLKDPP